MRRITIGSIIAVALAGALTRKCVAVAWMTTLPSTASFAAFVGAATAASASLIS